MLTTRMVRVPVERVTWTEIKERISIESVAISLLGEPAAKQGRRLLWHCPWHDDRHPSLSVDLDRMTWKCWPCGIGGDAVALAIKSSGSTFPEAVRHVAELCGLGPSSVKMQPTNVARASRAPARPPERPSGLPLAEAVDFVAESALRLWTAKGDEALTYLQSRGLSDETIHAARLGYASNVAIPKKSGSGIFRASGVVIPWFDGDRLAMVKIRQRDGIDPKYIEAFRDRPRIYPGPDSIQIGIPLVVAEGEFDAMLLRQQIGDLASVVTLGGASSPLHPDIKRLTRGSSEILTAHDADEAGDRSAAMWPARSRRVRPPEGSKDWTEVHATGFNRIRYLWGSYLPMSTPWKELAKQIWVADDGIPEELGCASDDMTC